MSVFGGIYELLPPTITISGPPCCRFPSSSNLRGHRDFDSHEHYLAFLTRNCHERNANRREAVALELAAMLTHYDIAERVHRIMDISDGSCRRRRDVQVRP